MIFSRQLISPKLLYLGNPEDLRDSVGGHFCSQSDSNPESRNRFRIGTNLKFLKLLIFSRQLISPKLLYLGNPEDLRDGVGDIFARKVMQIPNLETVFESEQI